MIALACSTFGGMVTHCWVCASVAFELALFDGVIVAAFDAADASYACVGGVLIAPAFLALRYLGAELGFLDAMRLAIEPEVLASDSKEVFKSREWLVNHEDDRGP